MKKYYVISILFAMLLFSNIAVASEACQLATPRYGVIQCMNTMQEETQHSNFENFENGWSLNQIPCLSNCELFSEEEILIDCKGIPWDEYKVYKNGIEKNIFPISWNNDDYLLIIGRCTSMITNDPVPQNAYVEYQQDKIMLYEGWAGTLPTKPLDYTEGCSINKIASNYHSDGEVQSFLNPETGVKENKPPSTYNSINEMSTNWEIGDNYVFVKDWQTGIADISLTYDKNDLAYWCGGSSGNRKIYNVNEIISRSNVCYAIPSSIAKQNIECCFPADCSWKGAKYTCNPDTWKCEETRWCDSDLDCQQVFGEGVCQNKEIIQWSCNFNKKWGDHSGTCEKEIRDVVQCPSDCTSDEYYNDKEGICKPRMEYINCPPGKCCDGGDSYKPQSCSSGLICCKDSNSLVGECKLSCEETKEYSKQEDSSSGITGNVVKETGSSSSVTGILIGILVLLGIGGTVYYLKSKSSGDESVEDVANEKSGIFCENCGSELTENDKFCTGCGNKV